MGTQRQAAPISRCALRMKRALDRDVSEPSSYPGIFAFELDFGGTLRCIPMSVRMKLDQ